MTTHAAASAKRKITVLRALLAKTPDSPKILFDLSDALDQDGQLDESIEVFRRAFALNPSACTGLADWNPGFGPEQGPKLRDRAARLILAGLKGSPVIAAMAIGEALCGNAAAVRSIVDYEHLFRSLTMRPPDGFVEFHAALASEIRENLRYYDNPADRSIRNAWRNNSLTNATTPACAAFTAAVRREVESYIATLPHWPEHPFVASRPERFRLEGWAVVSDGAGYHEDHIHPRAWMSCVYYVVRPPCSRVAGTNRGFLIVGPPGVDDPVSLPGWDTRLVEPEPGTLVLIPGYFFHRTYPMGVNEERICIAVDVIAE